MRKLLLKVACGLLLTTSTFAQTNSCTPWSGNGPWKGKGRIAISSDGNEHDKDDWAATPFSLALLAAKGLQDQLTLYTFSDHVWGSNHDHSDAAKQMRISALEGKEQFGFNNTNFIEAVANPNAAYSAMTAEINKSTADNPLFIVAAGPMQVVGKAINDADPSKLKHVRIISHSKWNDRHSDNPSSWENHSGWTWTEIENAFKSKGLITDHIVDQNGGTGYDGMRASASKFDWLLNHAARNNSLYKSGAWKWLYDRQVAAKKGAEFDPSDAGMIIYLLTGKEQTDPSDAKALMIDPVAPCSGSGNDGGTTTPNPGCDGISDVNGIIMLEAENTSSPLGLWKKKTDNAGYSGSGHLEFTGNGINGGPATSPLKYTFTVNEGGYYRLYIRARKRLEGAESDKCNDGYVKMEGDFDAGPDAGNNHLDDATEDMLRKNTKFFGGPANGWGWATQLDAGGHTNKRIAIYKFKAGETYTFTLSGRSIRWNVDRFVFRKEGVSNNDAYAVTEETGCSDNGGGTDPVDPVYPISDISDLLVEVKSCSEVVLSWSDVSGEEAYRVRRKIEGEATFTTLGDVGANVKSYSDKTVVENTNYIYQVRPMQGGKAVKASNQPLAKVGACEIQVPEISDITDLKVVAKNCSTVTLSWGDVSGEDAYRIRRKVEGEPTYTNLTDVVAGTTGYSDASVSGGITYIYMVRPVQAGVAVKTSNTPKLTVTECEIPQPKDCAGVEGGSASIDDCGICSGGSTGIEPSSPKTWYQDSDGDGKGDPNASVQDCKQPIGFVANVGDQCPQDGNKTNPGECGCGEPEGSCTVVGLCDLPNYASGKVYDQAGTEVIYEGKSYQNKWYTKGNTPGSSDVWELTGFCGAAPLDCSDYGTWTSGNVYSSPGTKVEYQGKVYSNKWYSQGNMPGSHEVWTFEGPCEGALASPLTSNVAVDVYPNPVSGNTLNIAFSETQPDVHVVIYNSFQQEVIATSYSSTDSIQLNVSGLVQGNYTLKITSTSMSQTVQLMRY